MESILDFLLNNLEVITSLVAGLAGAFWLKGKKAIKELGEAIVTVTKALEDDKLSKEEVLEITKEFKDVIAVFAKKKDD